MRILSITAQKPNSTGSGVYLTELVKEYAFKGHEQAVVAGVYENDKVEFPKGVMFYPVYFSEDVKSAGCYENGSATLPFPIVGMSDEMPYKSTRYCDMTPEMTGQFKEVFLKVIERAVKELSPDVVLCHHLYLLTALVREAFPELKVYGFCHNTDLRQMKKTDLERDFIREQILKLDHIFVPQKAQEEGVKEIYGMPSDKMTRVGMGFNRRIFHVTGKRASDGITRIIFAGKIAEKKGVVSLMKSLCLLDVLAEGLEVYLAGSTGNEREFQLIRELSEKTLVKVTFLGRLSQAELSKLYNACDIFVLPSFFEGIPLTVIEALACGNRVVMTDLPGIQEWLLETAPGADIRYVALPAMRNTDEPIKEQLPEFEKRLAEALEESIRKGMRGTADVSGISWEKIAEKVLGTVNVT